MIVLWSTYIFLVLGGISIYGISHFHTNRMGYVTTSTYLWVDLFSKSCICFCWGCLHCSIIKVYFSILLEFENVGCWWIFLFYFQREVHFSYLIASMLSYILWCVLAIDSKRTGNWTGVQWNCKAIGRIWGIFVDYFALFSGTHTNILLIGFWISFPCFRVSL